MARRLAVAALFCVLLLLVGCARPDPQPRPTEQPPARASVATPAPVSVKPSPAQVADDLVSQGLGLYTHGDRDAALAKFRAALKVDPNCSRAREWTAKVSAAKAAVVAERTRPRSSGAAVGSTRGYGYLVPPPYGNPPQQGGDVGRDSSGNDRLPSGYTIPGTGWTVTDGPGFVGGYSPGTGGGGKTVHVRSYTRRDGTVVRSHWRRPPSH